MKQGLKVTKVSLPAVQVAILSTPSIKLHLGKCKSVTGKC